MEEKPYISPQAEDEVDVLENTGSSLILYNDDVHTFDYVIKALVDICRHTTEQAEQCAILVHLKGSCVIKQGAYSELLPMHTALLDKQLTTEVVNN